MVKKLPKTKTTRFAGNIMNKKLTGILKIRLLANAFNRMSTDSLIIYLTVYIVERIGTELAGATTISILLVGFIANLYGGVYADARINKWALSIGWSAHTIISFLMLISIKYSIFIFLLLYLLKSIAFSFILPFSEKLTYNNTINHNRHYFLQINSWVSGVSSSLGIFIGGYLYTKNITYTLLFSMLMSLLVSICYFFIPKFSYFSNGAQDNIEKLKLNIMGYSMILKNKKATSIIISAIMLSGIEFSFSQYIPVYISNISFENFYNNNKISGVEYFSWIKTTSVIFGMVFSFCFIFLIKRLHENSSKRLLIISMTAFIFTYTLMLVNIENSFFLAVFAISSSLFGVIYHPICYSEYMNHVDKSRSGIYLSLYSLIGRSGNIVASLILIISSYTGKNGVTLISLIIGVASVIIMARVFHEERGLTNEDVKNVK